MASSRFFETLRRLSALFSKAGFHLYAIGGSSRDYLLGQEPADYDFVTDASPEDLRLLLPSADFTFIRFGSIHYMDEGKEIDIVCMREESGYSDKRHPSEVRFIRDPEKDSWRRDFTINALYLDSEGKVLDFHGGLADLESKTIRFIGDPRTRIQEDPLRILRAERFVRRLGFALEEEAKQAIEELRPLLKELNPERVKMEEKKG